MMKLKKHNVASALACNVLRALGMPPNEPHARKRWGQRIPIQMESLDLRQLFAATPTAVADVYNLTTGQTISVTGAGVLQNDLTTAGDLFTSHFYYYNNFNTSITGWDVLPSTSPAGFINATSTAIDGNTFDEYWTPNLGDGNRSLSVYHQQSSASQFWKIDFQNTTAATLTSLDLKFDFVVPFSKYNITNPRAAYMTIRYDPDASGPTSSSTVYTSSVLNNNSVTTPDSWLTEAQMQAQGLSLTGLTHTITGLNIAVGQTFSLQFGAPSIGNGLYRHMHVGFDNLSVGLYRTTQIVTGPAHGNVAMNIDGTFSYTANDGYVGTDNFTYKVWEGTAWSDPATVTLNVANVGPAATTDGFTINEDTPSLFDVLANDTDANHDTLTLTAVGSASHGTVSISNGKIAYTPDPNYHGSDSFTYTLADGHGGTATSTVTVTVNSVLDAPIATDDSVSFTTTTLIDALANDTDADSNNLQIVSFTTPTAGIVTIQNNKLLYTPTQYASADSFTYTIEDGDGLQSTATVYLNRNEVAPAPANDAFSTQEDTPALLDLLANDTDANGDALTISSVSTPAHGVATIQSGQVLYTPAANYFGTDSFTYTVTDGHGGYTTATVTLNIQGINDAPIAVDDEFTTDAATMLLDVLANDSDVDGPFTLVSASSSATGTLTIVGSSLRYTALAFALTDTFTYTIADAAGLQSTGSITIARNVPPPPPAQPQLPEAPVVPTAPVTPTVPESPTPTVPLTPPSAPLPTSKTNVPLGGGGGGGGGDTTSPTAPVTPTTPSTPSNPTTPTTPATPSTPAQPDTPTTPASPTNPSSPSNPTTPASPVSPSTPTTPNTPTHQDTTAPSHAQDNTATPANSNPTQGPITKNVQLPSNLRAPNAVAIKSLSALTDNAMSPQALAQPAGVAEAVQAVMTSAPLAALLAAPPAEALPETTTISESALPIAALDDFAEEKSTSVRVAVGAVSIAASATGLGVLALIVRGGTLLTTLLAALPTWRSFDPLPVLDAWEKRKHTGKHKNKNPQLTNEDQKVEHLIR